MRGAGGFSHSSVSTYLECPLRWKFLYVDRLPEAARGYFSFGRTVHAVLEELLRPFVAEPSTSSAAERQRRLDDWGAIGPRTGPRLLGPDEVLALYEKLWVGDGYTSADEEARYKALGAELLLRFRESLAAVVPTP